MTTAPVSLDPTTWPAAEIQKRLSMAGMSRSAPARSACGRDGVVAGTTGPLAVYAGRQALAVGGSAVDAAIVTSLMQVCLAGGAWVSYAGILSAVVADGRSGDIQALDGGFNTVRGEDDPLSIPAWPSTSGRTVLVPGYMASIQALHDRYGRLPWAELFAPAIHFAEHGVPLTPWFAGFIAQREHLTSRLPEGRALFRPEGELLQARDLFRQPATAQTLRRVADEGAAHVYTGSWAKDCVAAVQAEGGKLSAEDLARYQPLWTTRSTTLGEVELHTIGAPNFGAVYPVEALNLAQAADLAGMGLPATDPEALFWFIQITRQVHAFNTTLVDGGLNFDALDLEQRLTPEHAAAVWEQMRRAGRNVSLADYLADHHSDAVGVVDRDGTMVSLTHSINSLQWGHTGIFVGGIALPDSGALYQPLIAKAGPGGRLPMGMHALVATRDGRPVLASGAIGASGEAASSTLWHVLAKGMGPLEAVQQPSPLMPAVGILPGVAFEPDTQLMVEGDFPDDVLDGVRELGQPLHVLDPEVGSHLRGYWVGVTADAEGNQTAVAGPHIDGNAEAV